MVLEPTYGGVTYNKIPFIMNQNGSLHYVKGMSCIKLDSSNSECLWRDFDEIILLLASGITQIYMLYF